MMSSFRQVPHLGEAVVSHLDVHLVAAWRQHGEETGDVCVRPLRDDTCGSAHQHHAVIVSCSQVGAADGEKASTCKWRRPGVRIMSRCQR